MWRLETGCRECGVRRRDVENAEKGYMISRVWRRNTGCRKCGDRVKMLRDIVKECSNDVYGVRRVGGQRRKGSERWSPEIGVVVTEKRRAFVKQTVKVGKRMADWRWGERLGNDLQGNKKMFWREVKQVRKYEKARNDLVKEVNGQILRDGLEVCALRMWAEYF